MNETESQQPSLIEHMSQLGAEKENDSELGTSMADEDVHRHANIPTSSTGYRQDFVCRSHESPFDRLLSLNESRIRGQP